jgi:hypothetical protein
MENIRLGQLVYVWNALQVTWKEHLEAHPELTNAAVWARAREALDQVAPAYRDFPQFQQALRETDIVIEAHPGQPQWG